MKDSRKKPIPLKFTRAELRLIDDMCAIASAAPWGEGDYQEWKGQTGKVFDSLRSKIGALLNGSGL